MGRRDRDYHGRSDRDYGRSDRNDRDYHGRRDDSRDRGHIKKEFTSELACANKASTTGCNRGKDCSHSHVMPPLKSTAWKDLGERMKRFKLTPGYHYVNAKQ